MRHIIIYRYYTHYTYILYKYIIITKKLVPLLIFQDTCRSFLQVKSFFPLYIFFQNSFNRLKIGWLNLRVLDQETRVGTATDLSYLIVVTKVIPHGRELYQKRKETPIKCPTH